MDFREFGNQSGKTLLLLPGTACTWQLNFKNVVDEFAEKYHIIAVNYDGFEGDPDTVFTDMLTVTEKDEVAFTIDGTTYQGIKSEKAVVVKSVDKDLLSVEIPASVSYDGTTYQVIVMKSEGGEVVSTHVQAKQNQQVNLKIVPATGYFLANLSVKLQSGGGDVSTRITVDGQDNMYHSFLMPAGNVVVTATFEKTASNQNIFIFRAKYGEVVSHVLHADPGQQVNLETRVKNGFTNVELDELYVFNEEGKRMTINTIMDPKEGLVYYFFMEGERAYVFNTFKGLNDILDLSQPVLPDNILYLLNLYSGFLNTYGGAGGVQVATTLLANILAKFTSEGGLSVTLGEDDLPLVLLNLKSGWKIKFDFSGNIQIVNPEMLGLAKGATLTSGQFYELLTPGNLELLLNSSYRPLLIKSITVVAPETEDPTAINGLQADEEAGDTYDLSGRKVDTSVRLPKGVYIRNGKKIVLK